jgi:hypothetical protein
MTGKMPLIGIKITPSRHACHGKTNSEKKIGEIFLTAKVRDQKTKYFLFFFVNLVHICGSHKLKEKFGKIIFKRIILERK